jgi:hypothetical protein
MELGKPRSIEYEGETYNIELVGANSNKELVFDINGFRKTV